MITKYSMALSSKSIHLLQNYELSINEVANCHGVQFLQIASIFLLIIDKWWQDTIVQICCFVGSKFSIENLSKIDNFTAFQYLNSPDKIILILVISSNLFSTTDSTLNSNSLSPTILWIFQIFIQIFIDLRKGHFRCIDGSNIPQCSLEQKRLFLDQQLINCCKTFFNNSSFLCWFSYTILFMIQSSDNMCPYFMVQHSLQIQMIVLQRRSYFQHCLFFIKGYACSRKTITLKLYFHIFIQSQLLQIFLNLFNYLFLSQNRQFWGLEFVVYQYFMCKSFVLCVKRDDFWCNYSLIAKMRIVFAIFFKESLHLHFVIDWEQIFYLWILVLRFLILFLSPVV